MTCDRSNKVTGRGRSGRRSGEIRRDPADDPAADPADALARFAPRPLATPPTLALAHSPSVVPPAPRLCSCMLAPPFCSVDGTLRRAHATRGGFDGGRGFWLQATRARLRAARAAVGSYTRRFKQTRLYYKLHVSQQAARYLLHVLQRGTVRQVVAYFATSLVLCCTFRASAGIAQPPSLLSRVRYADLRSPLTTVRVCALRHTWQGQALACRKQAESATRARLERGRKGELMADYWGADWSAAEMENSCNNCDYEDDCKPEFKTDNGNYCENHEPRSRK